MGKRRYKNPKFNDLAVNIYFSVSFPLKGLYLRPNLIMKSLKMQNSPP